jgi:hypothetical protein
MNFQSLAEAGIVRQWERHFGWRMSLLKLELLWVFSCQEVRNGRAAALPGGKDNCVGMTKPPSD